MRASRLLSILISLQVRGRVSARELAEQLEVSKRTIYRDVDELSAAGVPIYAERGSAGGFALLDGWRTQLTGMTAAEAETLLFAGVPIAAADLGIGQDAAAARLKILAALSSPSSEAAARVSARFHLDPTPWHRRPAAPHPALRTIAQATWEARLLDLTYESWSGESRRVVEPLGLILKAGEWYFLARSGSRIGIRRLANVREATLLPERFDRPARFDLAKAWAEAVAGFEGTLRQGVARVRVASRALSELDRLGADMAEPIRKTVADADGWRTADVPIESIGYAAGLILGFSDDIDVLSPPELRDEVARRALAVAAMYKT
jgi:predicted DNA-binding transcriptional regulator YafY